MKWSWRLGSIAGIDVRVHATFLLLVLWIAWAYYVVEQSVAAAVGGVLFILLLFLIVVLHELGHALTARRYGIKTRDITLLPIGGVARLERMPENPKHELLVALAGPAVNFALAAVFGALAVLGGELQVTLNMTADVSLLSRLFSINIVLGLFNMLPAFPMDGGRALRALLAMRMDSVRATQVAATLGQTLALLLGFAGLFTGPILLFIALFVWLGAEAEAKMARVKDALDGIPVVYAMVPDVVALSPDDPLALAIERSLTGFQHDFPVVDGGRVVGVLPRADLIGAARGPGAPLRIADAMKTEFATAHPGEMLDHVLERLERSPGRCLPVVTDDGLLAGVLSIESVGELVALRSALRTGGRGHWPTQSLPAAGLDRSVGAVR